MQVIIPDMQPIRIRRYSNEPDWNTYWPNMDNISHRVNYIPGVYASEYYSDWLVNKQMSIQLRVTVAGDTDLTFYKFNESTQSYDIQSTVSPVDITPSGWVSDDVYRWYFTPTTAGVYYFQSASAGIRSDKFQVHSDLKFKKRLVQIEYYNTVNDYGTVFYNGSVPVYTGLVYLSGSFMPDIPGNEISAFVTDRGSVSKQRATPVNNYLLSVADVHMSELKRINLILSCDRLTVNGITCQNPDAPEGTKIENMDLYNLKVKLSQTNYNYLIS